MYSTIDDYEINLELDLGFKSQRDINQKLFLAFQLIRLYTEALYRQHQ